ncbi:DUF2793 domain-containing protein [Novosphingobium mangrovi (ex Huang et al. 2023)]|uniref:DUF2793 domain-containing protein n=1 Tax=Novosphingobium mangrovi (ex Huang et al. 2023) TaxID=2976432 RepID=A0ABT2I152_9SPHN|nr:DUF2793 domain-containing protein [Novosphingobium mangrovi (ex Huang et al. 2023)]MCT2398536.1 DUF2793 domain-containing protein [Novosphingobium mangrovi (ex Huang et al. 2023)]
MATPILGLDELVADQAGQEETINETNRWLEFLAAGAGIADRDLAAPPGSPADGVAYLVAASATGAWFGKDGNIALFISSAWTFKTPVEGMRLYVKDEDVIIAYDGSSWSASGGSIPTEASASEFWTGTATGKYVSPSKAFAAAAPQTLTDAATIAVDMATGINFNVTLGGNRTLGNPTNAKAGQSGRIRVTQDATGSRTLAFGANWKHVGSAPTIATAAGAVDLFAYFVNSGADIELSYLGTLA